MAKYAMEFCATESCGKCTPCRIGSTRGAELIDRITAGITPDANLALLDELCDTMLHGSLCGLGGLTPYPVQSAVKHFRADFVGRDRPASRADIVGDDRPAAPRADEERT
jgi:formate dehydrogenase iron-sulfur subunit